MRRSVCVSQRLVGSVCAVPKRKFAPSISACIPDQKHNLVTSKQSRPFHNATPRWLEHVASADERSGIEQRHERPTPAKESKSTVPLICPGCGALGQTVETDAPGYYNTKAKRNARKKEDVDADKIFKEAMSRLASGDESTVGDLNNAHIKSAAATESVEVPICDRCHYLKYQSHGISIVHPSMQSIQSIIEASPYKHNHIYHVLDAADFPMSLIPNLMSALRLPRLRTQNRRSKSMQWVRGRLAEVSFIITRADLLAPQKEQVDRLMPYLQEVLRDALGRSGQNVRLGNVRCVSAKRGWWTPVVKQDIWERGGAGWFVGKVNVGKSALFEVVFPKGRGMPQTLKLPPSVLSRGGDVQQQLAKQLMGQTDSDYLEEVPQQPEATTHVDDVEVTASNDTNGQQQLIDPETDVFFDEDVDASLLPPARLEVPFPQMPMVSSLPGTTASPIRIPYGGGKGELIDLPGVERSHLEQHVQPEHRSSLVMSSRVVPVQQAINSGQSLLLGGLIRLTPTSDDVQVLAYAFTPLKSHVTASTKAIAIQTGMGEDGLPYTGTVETIATATAQQQMQSAGRFALRWDVTRQRTGALTHKAAGKQKPENLPFIVYGADILLEGVGWIELTCQVRRYPRTELRDSFDTLEEPERFADADSSKSAYPMIEVFSPHGKFIGIRRPMNAWEIAGPKKRSSLEKSRPRYTISMKRRQAGGARGGPER